MDSRFHGNDGWGRINNKKTSYWSCKRSAVIQKNIKHLIMSAINNYMYSVIPAQAGIQKQRISKHERQNSIIARHEVSWQSIFFIFFYFAKSKALATIFLEQARKRQRTCHAVVSCILVFLILLGRCGTQLLLFTTTSNKSSRFILAKSKILRRHKCVGLKITIYYITKTLRVLVMRRKLLDCFVALRLSMME
jgi:hypothetical protein